MEIKKTCCTCKKDKLLYEFSKNKSKSDGFNHRCKECDKKYRENNKEKTTEYQKEYRKVNKKILSEKNKEYYNLNRNKIINKNKTYNKVNKNKIAKYKNEYQKIKKASDPLFRLSQNTRTAITNSIKKGGYKKTSKIYEIIGCSFIELMSHLNKNPYGFIYENGGFDIDHIVPISNATSEEELIVLNHYSNLQLLPSYYNKHIKLNKPFFRKHFEEWLKSF